MRFGTDPPPPPPRARHRRVPRGALTGGARWAAKGRLAEDLRSGVLLIALVETISGGSVGRYSREPKAGPRLAPPVGSARRRAA